jgi:hypothetical protein
MLEENQEDANKFSTPKNRIALVNVKPRVDSNNKLKVGNVGYMFQSPGFVLKKGKVKTTLNYIVDNLVPYGEPIVHYLQKQLPAIKTTESKRVGNSR